MNERAAEPTRDARTRTGEVDSAALFDGRREIVIRHAGSEYRLRITRSDKLILTK
jgi:hemin uptake protein HemP